MSAAKALIIRYKINKFFPEPAYQSGAAAKFHSPCGFLGEIQLKVMNLADHYPILSRTYLAAPNFHNALSHRLQQAPGLALLVGLALYLLLMPLLLVAGGLLPGGVAQFSQMLAGDFAAMPQGSLWFRTFQFLNQVLTYGLAGWIMVRLGGIGRSIGDARPQLVWLWAAAAVIAAIPFVQTTLLGPETLRRIGLPESLLKWAIETEQHSQQALLILAREPGGWVLLVNLLVFALAPALCEELFFRGFLQHQLIRLSPSRPWVGIFLGALIFSTLHFQFYGIIARALLGVLLGYFFYRSGSLWPGIVAHAVFNGVSILAMRLLPADSPLLQTESAAVEIPLHFAAPSLVVTLFFLYKLYLDCPSPQSNETI